MQIHHEIHHHTCVCKSGHTQRQRDGSQAGTVPVCTGLHSTGRPDDVYSSLNTVSGSSAMAAVLRWCHGATPRAQPSPPSGPDAPRASGAIIVQGLPVQSPNERTCWVQTAAACVSFRCSPWHSARLRAWLEARGSMRGHGVLKSRAAWDRKGRVTCWTDRSRPVSAVS